MAKLKWFILFILVFFVSVFALAEEKPEPKTLDEWTFDTTFYSSDQVDTLIDSGSGANLDYYGDWIEFTYSSNSLVRYNSNIWWNAENISPERKDVPPSLENSDWSIFLKDGTKGEPGVQGNPGTPGKNANIVVNSVTNVEPVIDGTNIIFGTATVKVVETNLESNTFIFDFGIPTGLPGAKGNKGDKGDRGAVLVPKGQYIETNTYYINDLVRFETAQYYVIDAPAEGITGQSPSDYPALWGLFVEDGKGLAVNATTLFMFNDQDEPIYYSTNVLLDTNTLTVVQTNINEVEYNALTVVGGGGAVKQWNIDDNGDLMPAIEMYAGAWDYDIYGDLMPPLEEEAHHDPIAIVQVPITASRIIDKATGTAMESDYIIWMDGDTAGVDQTLYLEDMSTNGQTIVVRQLGDLHSTTIVRNDKSVSLYGDGSSLTIDWLPAKNTWYWRVN